MKKTDYINSEGKVIKSHSGEPRKIESFLKNSESAIRIDISEFFGSGYLCRHFFKVDGKWVGEIFKGSTGWKRSALVPKKSLMHCVVESISEDESRAIIEEEAAKVLPYARQAVRWCDPKDQDDKDGRYWLSAYSGCGVYRLIVQQGKIVGSIYGGLHGSRRAICSSDAWISAVRSAIEERVEGEYHLLKADASGTYFYLRDVDNAQYLDTKKYSVPSAEDGMHLNIEVK